MDIKGKMGNALERHQCTGHSASSGGRGSTDIEVSCLKPQTKTVGLG